MASKPACRESRRSGYGFFSASPESNGLNGSVVAEERGVAEGLGVGET